MVTLIKDQLFLQKLNNKIPNFSSLKKNIIQYYEDERNIHSISGMYNNFFTKMAVTSKFGCMNNKEKNVKVFCFV